MGEQIRRLIRSRTDDNMQTEGRTELPAWTDAQMAGDPRDGRTELPACGFLPGCTHTTVYLTGAQQADALLE